MNDAESRPLAPPLAHRLADGASSAQIAEVFNAVWAEIGVALVPILGHLGVAALCERSLHLCVESRPWMHAVVSAGQAPINASELTNLLSQQSPAVAAQTATAMLQELQALLTRLLGSALAQRLLVSVWPPAAAGATARESA